MRQFRRIGRAVAALLCASFLFAALCGTSAGDDEPAGERPDVLRAAGILRGELLLGDSYRIEDEVALRNHRYQFTIVTRWGTLEADGLNELGLRLQEVAALERADELSRSPQFIGGLVDSVSQTPRGVGVLLSNPVGAVLGLPEGVKRIASTRMLPADRRAGSVTRRRLAWEIGCDPETANPLLKPQLDQLATRKGLGQLAGKVGMSAAVPGLGLVPLTAEMQTTLVVKLPHEIHREIDRDLQAMGVAETTRAAFLASPHFTTGRRLILMSQLEELSHVENRAAAVESAARAASEADALAAIDQLRMLIDLDSQKAIARLDDVGAPAAVLEGGGCVLAVSVDSLQGSDDAAALLAAFRARQPTARSLLICSGRVSPAAMRLLSQAQVTAVELR